MSDDGPRVDPRTFDLTTALFDAVMRRGRAHPDGLQERATAAALAYQHSIQYAAAARRQMERLDAASREAERAFDAGDNAAGFAALDRAYSELHFYLTCWAMTGRMMGAISGRSQLPAIRAIHRRHLPTFERYGRLRDHVEHVEQRLPGLSRGEPFLVRSPEGGADWGWRGEGWEMAVGDERWDIGPASLALLESIVADLTATVREARWTTV